MKKQDIFALILIMGLGITLISGIIEDEFIIQTRQTLVSLTLDDGYKCWIDDIDPVLEQYNLSITAFISDIEIVKERIKTTNITITWEIIELLHATGRWEFGFHTLEHYDLTRLNYNEQKEQIQGYQELFEEHGLPEPKIFCYPFGSFNKVTKEIVSEYFLAARTSIEGINTVKGVKEDPMRILVQRINHERDNNYYKNKVTENVNEGVYLVFYFHSMEEFNSRKDISIEDFKEFIGWLVKQDVKIVNFSDGIEEMKSRNVVVSKKRASNLIWITIFCSLSTIIILKIRNKGDKLINSQPSTTFPATEDLLRTLYYLTRYIPFTRFWMLHRLKWMLKDPILDLGCHIGDTFWYMKFQGHIIGVDIESKYFTTCERRGIYKNLIKADVLDFVNRLMGIQPKYGCVTCFFVLEHLKKDDGLALLEKMKKIGKNVLVIVPKGYRPQESPDGNPYQEHISEWNKRDLLKAGFDVMETWALTIKKVIPYKIYFGIYTG